MVKILLSLFCVLRTLLGNCQVWAPEYGRTEMRVKLHLRLRSYQLSAPGGVTTAVLRTVPVRKDSLKKYASRSNRIGLPDLTGVQKPPKVQTALPKDLL